VSSSKSDGNVNVRRLSAIIVVRSSVETKRPAADTSSVSLQPEDMPGAKVAERLVFVVPFLAAAITGMWAGYLLFQCGPPYAIFYGTMVGIFLPILRWYIFIPVAVGLAILGGFGGTRVRWFFDWPNALLIVLSLTVVAIVVGFVMPRMTCDNI